MERPSYRGVARCDTCREVKMCTRIPYKLDTCDDCYAEYEAEVAPLRELIKEIDFDNMAAIDDSIRQGRATPPEAFHR